MTVELITNLENHKRRIWSICWSPDGNFLASVGADKYITIWYKKNIDKAKKEGTKNNKKKFGKSNKFDKFEKFEKNYNEKYGIEFGIHDIIETNHEKSLRHIEFSKDGNFFIVASFDSKCSIYVKQKNNKWKFYKTLEGHEKEVKCASIHPTNKYIVTCGRDKSIWVHAKSKSLTSDNNSLKTETKINSLQNDEQTDKAINDSDQNDHKGEETEILNPNECLEENKNKLDNNESFDFNFDAYLTAHNEDIKFVTWCPLSETTFISLSYDNSLKLWNKKNDEWYCIQTINDHKSVVWCAAFNFDGSQFATCSDDKTIRIWESAKKNTYNQLKYPFLYRQIIKDENNNSFYFDINNESALFSNTKGNDPQIKPEYQYNPNNENFTNLNCADSDKNAKALLNMYTKNNFLPLYFQYGMFKTVYSYPNGSDKNGSDRNDKRGTEYEDKAEQGTENNHTITSQKKWSIGNSSDNSLNKTNDDNQNGLNEININDEKNKNKKNSNNMNTICSENNVTQKNEFTYDGEINPEHIEQPNYSSITNIHKKEKSLQNVVFDDWKIKHIIEGYHKRSISYLDWNVFEDLIAASSFDNSLKIFSKNNQTWDLVENVEDAHISDVNCVVWCPQKYQNYFLLATTGDDCVINIWMYKKE
ncbi:cytosolic iron-sulfur protein assembly protein 1, putative [Plasmodium chabaudi chabaudi]|uniref:Probable cytosolic iron-sulfur protein assembly protein CIAO1 homolog n=1 Tax=Plasmodium chabaudi chabaudi TaxID=31271 RepID=A0A1D3RRX9_PLACU|nr:cytosolic iron-sulfur protein assembly protein 1, putative [Plasmodium chabaudi chabaudi]